MTRHDFQDDLDAVARIDVLPSILDILCMATGMGFAALARVTEDRWIACQVKDAIGLGLQPGAELDLKTTLCEEVRHARQPVVIEHVAEDATYCGHHTPALYGFQSYVSMPIQRRDGRLFGTLCALDPQPRKVGRPETIALFARFAELIAFHLDADERLAAADAVRRSDALTRSMLAATPDCVTILSPAGIVEFINARGLELHRFGSLEEVVGQDFAALWPEAERPKIRAAVAEAEGGAVGRCEGLRPTAGGAPRWWETSFARFHPEGEAGPAKLVGVSRDVTERVLAEQERHRIATALHELNETLEQRVEARTAELQSSEATLRQSQKMEAVGQLTGGLAHDFNNLLTGITGNLELLERRLATGRAEEAPRFIAAIHGAAGRAAALTHRLLAFSRKQALAPQAIDVNRLVEGMGELIRNTVGPAIAFTSVAEPRLWTTLIDPSQLENALLNLCLNARDAMPEGGRLAVTTRNLALDAAAAAPRGVPAGDYVLLSVEDSGTGMAPETVARAFDPFFTTKPVGQGTGLGLSMIHGFTEQSGGHVRILSKQGAGTTISLYLPRHDGAAEAPASAASPVSAAAAQRGETVLVVEDDPTVNLLVTEVLSDLGYRALTAASGPEGLQILRTTQRVDLLVTDFGLPGGLNGCQLAEAARQLRPGLKVLVVSGYAEAAILGAAAADPGLQVLAKPFPLEVLAERLRLMTAGNAVPAAPAGLAGG